LYFCDILHRYKANEEPRLINVAYFCVAGVDGLGRPLDFPEVIAESEDERSRYSLSQVIRGVASRARALMSLV
jgi:hypothetical protein